MRVETKLPQVISDNELKRLWEDVSDAEGFLEQLRTKGASKIESIRALRRMAQISLGDAKQFVHLSAVWADRQEADEFLHEEMLRSLSDDLDAGAHPERLAS